MELEEKNSVVKKSEKNFKYKEQELNKVSRELEECITKCSKLNEMNEILNMELKATKKNLCDIKLSAKHMEQKFKLEREHLSNELEISCKKTNELEMRYDETKRELNGERCTIKTFYKKMKESNKANEKTHLETKKQFQKLNENLWCLQEDSKNKEEKVNKLEQENDCKCMEINTLKNKLYERDGQLQQMYLLSEKIEEMKKKKIEASCCTKKKTETNTCCLKEKTKGNISCVREDSTTNMCCCTTNNEKVCIQSDATKSKASNKNIHKTLLKNLICDLGNLLHGIF